MALKKITAQKTKKKRKRKRKRKRHQNQNANSTGRSYSAPKPVWELLLVRQLQIILGEKLFGPQARLRITPIAWFEPATSMTSLALVARPRLPVDHLEYASLINISCRYREFSNTGLGGGGGGRGGGGWGSLSKWECNRAFSFKNKGNELHKELKEVISTTNISICGNGGRPRSLGLVKHNDSDTSQRSYQLCALALVRFVYNGE